MIKENLARFMLKAGTPIMAAITTGVALHAYAMIACASYLAHMYTISLNIIIPSVILSVAVVTFSCRHWYLMEKRANEFLSTQMR